LDLKQVDYVKNKVFVLDSGKYLGYDYYIFNGNICPFAYINIPKRSILFEKERFIKENIFPHGSISRFCRALLINNAYMYGYWIGWDYGLEGDYTTLIRELNVKKWTTEEILNDVINTIEILKENENEVNFSRLSR